MNSLEEKLKQYTVIDDDLIFKKLGDSCAIIGNSGNVLEYEYGQIIDSHDCVIRCNEAKIKGYEKHVGTKKTIRVANSHMFHAVLSDTTLSLDDMKKKFSGFDRYALYDIKNEIILAKSHVNPVHDPGFKEVFSNLKDRNNSEVKIVNSSFHSLCESFLGAGPTCGFLGLMLALKYFKKISCFGFSFYEEEDWKKKHYYEEITPYSMSSHKFKKEKEIFCKLANNSRIKMFPYCDNEK